MDEIAVIYKDGAATMKIKTDFCEISDKEKEERIAQIGKMVGKFLKAEEIEGCYRGKDKV